MSPARCGGALACMCAPVCRDVPDIGRGLVAAASLAIYCCGYRHARGCTAAAACRAALGLAPCRRFARISSETPAPRTVFTPLPCRCDAVGCIYIRINTLPVRHGACWCRVVQWPCVWGSTPCWNCPFTANGVDFAHDDVDMTRIALPVSLSRGRGVHHNNLMKYYGVCVENSQVYVVTELLRAGGWCAAGAVHAEAIRGSATRHTAWGVLRSAGHCWST